MTAIRSGPSPARRSLTRIAVALGLAAAIGGCVIESEDAAPGLALRDGELETEDGTLPWNPNAVPLLECKGDPELIAYWTSPIKQTEPPAPDLDCAEAQALATTYLQPPEEDGFDQGGSWCTVSVYSYVDPNSHVCDDSCRGPDGEGALVDYITKACFSCSVGIEWCVVIDIEQICHLYSTACVTHCPMGGCAVAGQITCIQDGVFVCAPCTPDNSSNSYLRLQQLPYCDQGQSCVEGLGCCTPEATWCVQQGWECGGGTNDCGQAVDCGGCPPEAVGCSGHQCISPSCGDGACSGTETCSSCPADCGACAPSCGDGACNGTETCGSCPADCGACGPDCGNGICEAGEDCPSCPFDCGPCPWCGDGSCDFGEDCSTCPADCGGCGASCGDGACNGTETCYSCPPDCGTCGGCAVTCTDAWGGDVCEDDWGWQACPGGGVRWCQCGGSGNWINCVPGCNV